MALSPRLRVSLKLSMVLMCALIASAYFWLHAPFRALSNPAHDSAKSKSDPRFVGSESCASCHPGPFTLWKNSQHAHAMEPANTNTVLGKFDHTPFHYAGVVSTFFQRDGKYFVLTDGSDGKLATFEIKYTFGVMPLQQYLIEFPDGRLQALSIAWDSRPSLQGGQRWFHLYPNEKINSRDELHWTGRMQNWNFMCADCHSTDVRKNYNAESNTFRTTWKEISVGCEACHGPGSQHLDWARHPTADASKGLTAQLNERANTHWMIDNTSKQPKRSQERQQDKEIEVCAQCHSRRAQIAEGYQAGLPFQDFYRPSLLEAGLYFADGQQRDEVYNWGSFLQSRMYRAGVTCSDCHEPHGQKLRAPGNAVCSQCHLATRYDTAEHHHHVPSKPGAQCVDCHMPTTTYMVVDPRHDHSFRIPRPDLTLSQGLPNACNSCHRQQNPQWALAYLNQWFGQIPQGMQNFATAFSKRQHGSAQAATMLAAIAQDTTHPQIVRATALESLSGYPESTTAALSGLSDKSALIRRASITALSLLPPADRRELIAPLLHDPLRTVRIEAASALADAMDHANPHQTTSFARAGSEYEAAQLYQADRPEARAALGTYSMRRGLFAKAETQLKSALQLEPSFVPAIVNLVDLFRLQGRDTESEMFLREGMQHRPESAIMHQSLGLLWVRLGRKQEALVELKRATEINPVDVGLAYMYAIGLQSSNQTKAALRELDRGLALHPDDRDLLLAAITMRRDSGDFLGAQRKAQRLLLIYPEDPMVQKLARDLGEAPRP